MTLVRIGLCLALAGVALAARPAAAQWSREPVASLDDPALLRMRFFAAMNVARNPVNLDHGISVVEILQSTERDFGLDLGIKSLTRTVIESSPRAAEAFQAGKAPGIKHYRFLETAAARTPEERKKTFVVDALNMSGLCLPADAEYNLRFIDYLERMPWGDKMSHMAPVRYAVYLRMLQRGCVSQADFLARTKPLVPGVSNELRKARAPGDAGSYMYLFAASGRFAEVPRDLLYRYFAAQGIDAVWRSTLVGDASVASAQGAYLIAAVLKERGIPLTNLDVYGAAGKQLALPAPLPFDGKM